MYFGNSGDYVVEGALNPVSIDLQNNVGEYIEPNVWVLHEFGDSVSANEPLHQRQVGENL